MHGATAANMETPNAQVCSAWATLWSEYPAHLSKSAYWMGILMNYHWFLLCSRSWYHFPESGRQVPYRYSECRTRPASNLCVFRCVMFFIIGRNRTLVPADGRIFLCWTYNRKPLFWNLSSLFHPTSPEYPSHLVFCGNYACPVESGRWRHTGAAIAVTWIFREAGWIRPDG